MKASSRSFATTLGVISGVMGLISLLGGGGGGAILIAFLIFISAVLYFLPTFVALEREHDNSLAIGVLNGLLGWLALPWIGALIWALSRNRAAELIHAAQVEPEPDPWAHVTSLQASRRTPPDERTCPFCAEKVKTAAKICKHCHSELPPLEAPLKD